MFFGWIRQYLPKGGFGMGLKTKPELINPGLFLKEYLEGIEMTQKELGVLMGLPQSNISRIISGTRRITVRLAYQLEDAIGVPAKTWLWLQLEWDLEVINAKESLTNNRKQRGE